MGVRGITDMPGKPAPQPGFWADGTQFARTNISAFQMLWFDLVAAQLGYSGTVKWDAYWGKYDSDYVASLLSDRPRRRGLAAVSRPITRYASCSRPHSGVGRSSASTPGRWTTGRRGVPDQSEKELAAYASVDGQLTLMGLDTHARELNAISTEKSAYSIGGLPANTMFNLALWNASGNGENSLTGTLTTDAAGVARFEVPLHAAFSLTTVPVS